MSEEDGRMRQRRGFRVPTVLPAVALAAVVLVACGGEPKGGTAEQRGGALKVTLQEWAVIPEADSVGAGRVTFTVTNTGPDHEHEFVVIRTDLAADGLPTTDEGVVDEQAAGIEIIGEIEEFPVGETQRTAFDLDPGSYVLVCNVAPGAEHGAEEVDQGHYTLGMRAALTVG